MAPTQQQQQPYSYRESTPSRERSGTATTPNMQNMRNNIQDFLRNRPGVATLSAVAAGFLVARLFHKR